MDHFKNSLDYATALAATTQRSLLLQRIRELWEIYSYKEKRGKKKINGLTKTFDIFKFLRLTSSFYHHAFHKPSSSFVFSDSSHVYVYDLLFILQHINHTIQFFQFLRFVSLRLITQCSESQCNFYMLYPIWCRSSLQWRYLCIWEDVSWDGKLLRRLLQFIFLVINVKCDLL